MPKTAVFVTSELPEEAREILSNFEVFESDIGDSDLPRCEALVTWPSRAKPELLSKMKTLKMVQTISAGVDLIDFGSLPAEVQVFSNAGAFTDNVAEHAWGMLLGVAKGIQLRNQKTAPRRFRGRTLLVVGCGSIGSEVARLAKSLEMRTVGVSRSYRSPELFDEKHPMTDLASVFAEADAALVTLPLTKGTRGVFSYDVLSKGKEAVIVANVGRGETFDEEGLLRWLRERPESRFVTDVFWFKEGKESFSTGAWDFPNFAGTLHISGLPLGEDLTGAKVAAARNVRRFFESADPINRVDRNEYD